MSALNLIYKDRMTFGIELSLDRDWSEAGQRLARIEGRPFGVPDISNPAKGVELAENLGFDAVWLRDVPVHDPSFGDVGQVFDPFPYLGFLAGRYSRRNTEDIAYFCHPVVFQETMLGGHLTRSFSYRQIRKIVCNCAGASITLSAARDGRRRRCRSCVRHNLEIGSTS